jgi:GTP-binding protein
MEALYITSAAKWDQLPPISLPEVVMVGRSNVGKSSLINSLTNQKNLARTSNTPGRTQMVNFFQVNRSTLLVDLPGYSYADAPSDVRKDWPKLMQTYLERPSISKICYLFDVRRDLSDDDFVLAKQMADTKPIILVVTKIDKLSRSDYMQKANFLKNSLLSAGANIEEMFMVSSQKKLGIAELRRHLRF